ncbi:DUF6415 family natural product biosynthesis protein [Streptomyces sp. NPDC015032]|uniref:DUF6415 family natural product biosynthesis protein n=1 Tax=Streptomyces sp. NPDC015032 TaxID=3364937 RepID=UPI003701614C
MTASHPRETAPVARPASTHTVLYDPDGLIEAGLPLDREPYECLVKAVLAWTGKDTLTTRDLEQIALQLTGHARAVAADVRRRADWLPKNSGPKALADIVLREAEGRLSAKLEGTVRCVQNRARLVRALYDAMNDRMRAALHKVWGEQGPVPVQRGSVALMTQEFRAAVATGSAY